MAPRAPRIAINGFGRIGRLVLRALLEETAPVEVVAVNDLTPASTLAHLFKHDTVHGRWPGTVTAEDGAITIDGHRIRALQERDPAQLPWRELGIDYVVESTGRFTDRAALQKHLDAGARRVLLSAPGTDVDITIVRGVNDRTYDPARHRILSNASCTTNCLAPVLKVLHESFGIEQACMTTIHAYTNDQSLLDSPHKDPRRSRAAAASIVPTSTGAARAIAEVIPELAGKVDGMAVRVPVVAGSLIDVCAHLSRVVEREELVDAFRRAAEGPLNGILGVEEEALVSADFIHDPRSAIVDLPATMADTGLVKILAWYDNEWGYSKRTAEMVLQMADREEGVFDRVPAEA